MELKSIVFAFAIVLTACSESATAPGLNISFSTAAITADTVLNGDTIIFDDIQGEGWNAGYYPPFAMANGNGRLEISGLFFAGCASHPMEGTVNRSGTTIEVHVRSAAIELCLNLPTYYYYSAQISPLDSGRYELRVIHEGDGFYADEHGLTRPTVVLEQQVYID